MKKVLKVNIFFLILILLQIKGGYLLIPIRNLIKNNTGLLLLTTQIAFLIIPIVIYMLITKQSIRRTFRFNKINFTSVVLLVVMGLFFIPLAGFLSYLTSFFYYNNVQDVFNKLQSLPIVVMVAIVALTPACCEELTMRGVVLSGYDDVKLWKAALINGFLFAVLHLNPPQFLYAFALGIILACVVRITNSIFASMIIHFTFNGVNTLMSWAILKGASSATIKKSQQSMNNTSMKLVGLASLFIVALIAVAVIIGLMKELIKESKRGAYNNIPVSSSGSHEVMTFTNKAVAAIPIVISVVIYVLVVTSRGVS
ncbi:CPBP family intramembrane glutamic endopeptidase [Clostridium hydrogenum]|uniref:CPBP family intramembrane glutamic endopeptidase n=1 Tax=Clostridium hydrogenum TaxID=2855764 RepID=UPI001F24BC08|nr:type II CAAX endopeptidase family protein [Clostridium hydrogenum]